MYYKRFIKGGLRWEDIEIEDLIILNSAIVKEIAVFIPNLFICYSKIGEPLDITCNCLLFLTRYRKNVN